MRMRPVLSGIVGLGLLAALACDSGTRPEAGKGKAERIPFIDRTDLPVAQPARRIGSDPLVITDCRITPERRDVPSQRDGKIDQLLIAEGDVVKEKAELARQDDRLANADFAKSVAKVTASNAEYEAALATREEAKKQYLSKYDLMVKQKAVSPEDVRVAELSWKRYIAEATSKKEAIVLANEDVKQAELIVKMHRITSPISGIVKTVFKKNGEYVKNGETVFQVHNLDVVELEGLVDEADAHRVKLGMPIVVEPSIALSPKWSFRGHLQEVNAVAVSRDFKDPAVVSADEEGIVRVWHPQEMRERLQFVHPGPVKAVACTGLEAAKNLCLTGCADGRARLFDLDKSVTTPLLELTGYRHQGGVTAVAFSADGKACVTGGEDREICLWDVGTGALRYRFPSVHGGGVTCLTFAGNNQVVSAGRDKAIVHWELSDKEARADRPIQRKMGGEVTTLGISPDGKQVLYDEGKILRVLSLPLGATDNILQNPTSATNFTTFALFSPNGQLIVTASGRGRMQMWHRTSNELRAFEVRTLDSKEKQTPTSAAFFPDGKYLVTGTRERQVLVWPVPTAREEIDRRLIGKVTLVEPDVQSSSRQVRIRASVPNPGRVLVAGSSATIVINDQ